MPIDCTKWNLLIMPFPTEEKKYIKCFIANTVYGHPGVPDFQETWFLISACNEENAYAAQKRVNAFIANGNWNTDSFKLCTAKYIHLMELFPQFKCLHFLHVLQ